MKKVLWIVLPAILLFIGTAEAQDQDRIAPMLEKGTKELGFSGYIDFEGPAGGVDIDLDIRYGYFMARHIEIGGFGNYSRTMDGDVVRYGLGGFAEYHMFGSNWDRMIPYFGADLGLFALNWDVGENQNALAFVPRIGIKWFYATMLRSTQIYTWAWQRRTSTSTTTAGINTTSVSNSACGSTSD